MNMDPSINVNWVPGISLEEMEKQCILAAFRFYRGNKTATASALGIAIRTLENKMEKYESDHRKDRDGEETERERQAEILERMRGTQLTKQFTSGSSNQWAAEPRDNGEPTPDLGAFRDGKKANVQENKANGEAGNGSNAGVHVEPTSQASAEPRVPVSERKEVQSVLPGRASAGGKHRNR